MSFNRDVVWFLDEREVPLRGVFSISKVEELVIDHLCTISETFRILEELPFLVSRTPPAHASFTTPNLPSIMTLKQTVPLPQRVGSLYMTDSIG